MITRRAMLAGATALAACGPKLAKRFNGYAFVANRGSRTVAAVNLTRFKTEKQIALEGAPEEVAAHAGGFAALVLLPEAGTVAEITAERLSISRKRRLAARAITMRLAEGSGRLWLLASDPQALISLDLRTWERARPIPLPHPGRDFDVSEDGRSAVVSYANRNLCALIDLAGGGPPREIPLAADAGIARFRPDGKQVLIGSASARILTVAERSTGRILVALPLPFGPERVCFSVDKGQMFVTGRGMDAVAIVYPYQTEVAETILAGREPGAMAANENLLFVANPPTGDTTVIAIGERQVVAKVETGREPCAIALTPDGEYALVLNRKSGDMAVVRIAKLTDLRYKRAPLFTVIAVGEEPVSAAVCRL